MAVISTELSMDPLKKTAATLKLALSAEPKNDLERDGVIQRFEYTFELSWKTLKRYFETTTSVEEFNIKNLFREAGKQKLIDSVENWFGYAKARNQTSHIYDQTIAGTVFEEAKKFSRDVEILISRLEKKLG